MVEMAWVENVSYQSAICNLHFTSFVSIVVGTLRDAV